MLPVKIVRKSWKKYLQYKGKNPVIYAKCDKAIYETVTAALLSHKKLVGNLVDWEFEMNPYKPCCWNKTINGEQFTIVFHVDNLKLSYKDSKVASAIIAKSESLYATTDPITVHQGKVYHYLGMTMDFIFSLLARSNIRRSGLSIVLQG